MTLWRKFVLVGTVLLLLALASIGLTLSITWQLEGGAAAVNEAGRMRMQTYRLALAVEQGRQADAQTLAERFDRSFELMQSGDPSRPLLIPRADAVHASLAALRLDWQALRARWIEAAPSDRGDVAAHAQEFAAKIDAFVGGIEDHLSRLTGILNVFQLTMLALAVASAIALLYAGHLLVIDPVNRLREGLRRVAQGEFSVRVDVGSVDEFGQLADGFNAMAEQLKRLYQSLEDKVAEKTSKLEAKQERLAALYDVTTLMAQAPTLEVLGDGFANRLARISGADAVAVRWADAQADRFILIGSHCLPEAMQTAERCVHAGDCHCGVPDGSLRIIPIRDLSIGGAGLCREAGFSNMVAIPVAQHGRTLGEIEMFFRSDTEVPEAERALYEAIGAHLASAIESLRVDALGREAAVAEERQLLARELHDSIAQSLAFLKIQVKLLRGAISDRDAAAIAATVDEIDAGVRESYGDVRELLLHFRTRTAIEDIEPALRTTLSKFEHQTGIHTVFEMRGNGLPLSPDVQVQVLHVIQEALSNVRKHAGATQVRLRVDQEPVWRFEIVDDGKGFEPARTSPDETRVGLSIMDERARRIGAEVDVWSRPGQGTRVVVTVRASPTIEPAVEAPVAVTELARAAQVPAPSPRAMLADD